MGDLVEVSIMGPYRVYFERNRDSQLRLFFSAYVQLPACEQIILDDRILPRLKQTISEVLRYRESRAA